MGRGCPGSQVVESLSPEVFKEKMSVAPSAMVWPEIGLDGLRGLFQPN